MSISRKNWSALSSLARQRTMEDEEEVERERRRRVRSTSSANEPDAEFSTTPSDTPFNDSPRGTESTREMSQSPSSVDQTQMDFVEMLRVRDEKRRVRHVQSLRRQKVVEEDGVDSGGGEENGGLDEKQGSVKLSIKPASKPQPLRIVHRSVSSCSMSTNSTNRSEENGELPRKDPDPELASKPARMFTSSVSISFDKSPSSSGRTTPMSPLSPTTSMSPRGHWPAPNQSPSPGGPQSPIHNGHPQEASVKSSSSSSNFEQTAKPAFIKQSSRTISFRMMKKKEEESAPLQRSASVRMASKKFETNPEQNVDDNKTSSFQRNSKQRISSRSIQEKMERLAQAAQRSEMTRPSDVTQRTLYLQDEVSRKKGIFEKELQVSDPVVSGAAGQEIRSLPSGTKERINRWLSKTKQTGSSHNPADLRHVDITSKRSMFEKAGDCVPNNSPGKIYK